MSSTKKVRTLRVVDEKWLELEMRAEEILGRAEPSALVVRIISEWLEAQPPVDPVRRRLFEERLVRRAQVQESEKNGITTSTRESASPRKRGARSSVRPLRASFRGKTA